MTTDNTNEKLLQEFFAPAREMKIEDNGFTERVMKQLPEQRAARESRLWTWSCIMIGVVLFFVMRGWEAIATGLVVFIRTAPTEYNPLLLLLSFGVLLGLVAKEVAHREQLSL